MSPRWIKLLRDAQAARGRLATVVAALAASIAAVVTMASAYAVLMREVPRNYLATNPASAQLELTGELDAALLAQVRTRPGIADAELGAAVVGRIRVGADDWLPLMLFVVPSFETLRINVMQPEAGVWPAPTGSLLIERSALLLAQTSIGATIDVELPDAGQRRIRVAGTVHDPSVAPAWQEQTVYAYATRDTLAQLGEIVPLDLLKIVVAAPDGNDAQAIERRVRSLAAWLAAQGQAVHEARIPPPRLHPHQAQMNAVLTMLLIFSLLALLLGATLTATIVGGLLIQQVRQIAIMKAVGGRARQIMGMYFTLVGALGGLALLLGLPLGIAAGRGFIALVAELLNLRIESVALPGSLMAAIVILGLIAPLVAAGIPVRAAARRTVRTAIDDHGVSRAAPDAAGGWWMRWLQRLPMSNAGWSLTLRNTFRRRMRLMFTLALLAGAGAMFITSLNLKASWEDNVAQSARDRRYALELRLQRAAPRAQVLERALTLPGVSAVEPWDIAPASIAGDGMLDVVRAYPDGAHGGFALRAAPPGTALIAHAMLEGRWLRPDDDGGVVINTLARATAFRGVWVGDTVTLQVDHRPARLRVVGVMRELMTPGAAYVTPALFARLTSSGGAVNDVRLALTDPAHADALARDAVRTFERAGLGVRMATTERRFAAAQGGHVYVLVFALGFIAALMAVVGLLGLASALGNAVIERAREFGVLRALGAQSTTVFTSVVGEGLLTALLSVALAALLALGLSARVGQVLAAVSTQVLSLQLSPQALATWLGVVTVGAIVAAWRPARRAVRLTVRESLTQL